MTHHDDIDRLLGSIGDRAVALDRDPPPYWVDLTAKTVLVNPVVEVVADCELTSPGADAYSLAYSATRLGVTSRRAACEALHEPQADAAVTRLIEETATLSRVGDWSAAVCVTARGLMAVGDGTFSTPHTSVLTPRALRRELRERLGRLMITSILYDQRGDMRDLGSLSADAVLSCWYFGFCLSACRASLPDAAVQELSSFRGF